MWKSLFNALFPHLGNNKEFLPFDFARVQPFFQDFPDIFLIFIHVGSVNMAVAEAQGQIQRFFQLWLIRCLKRGSKCEYWINGSKMMLKKSVNTCQVPSPTMGIFAPLKKVTSCWAILSSKFTVGCDGNNSCVRSTDWIETEFQCGPAPVIMNCILEQIIWRGNSSVYLVP